MIYQKCAFCYTLPEGLGIEIPTYTEATEEYNNLLNISPNQQDNDEINRICDNLAEKLIENRGYIHLGYIHYEGKKASLDSLQPMITIVYGPMDDVSNAITISEEVIDAFSGMTCDEISEILKRWCKAPMTMRFNQPKYNR